MWPSKKQLIEEVQKFEVLKKFIPTNPSTFIQAVNFKKTTISNIQYSITNMAVTNPENIPKALVAIANNSEIYKWTTHRCFDKNFHVFLKDQEITPNKFNQIILNSNPLGGKDSNPSVSNMIKEYSGYEAFITNQPKIAVELVEHVGHVEGLKTDYMVITKNCIHLCDHYLVGPATNRLTAIGNYKNKFENIHTVINNKEEAWTNLLDFFEQNNQEIYEKLQSKPISASAQLDLSLTSVDFIEDILPEVSKIVNNFTDKDLNHSHVTINSKNSSTFSPKELELYKFANFDNFNDTIGKEIVSISEKDFDNIFLPE